MPTAIEGHLLDLPLLDLEGRTRTLRDFDSTPLVAVFVRHYGCLFCRERAAEVRAHRARIESTGARVVFVGTGLPAMAREFAMQFGDGLPVLSDPTQRVFAAAGMKKGLRTVLGLRFVANALRALRRGHRQSRVQGAAMQQGGVLVLAAGGTILHAQRDDLAGDAIDWSRALAALPAAAVSRA